MGAALVHLLDARSTMGLAAPPDESVPLELLTEEELLRRALAEREHRASEETMKVRSMDPATPWTDYVVTSAKSGKTYRVACVGASEASLLQLSRFSDEPLGNLQTYSEHTCESRKTFPCIQTRTPHKRKNISVRVDYGQHPDCGLTLPQRCPPKSPRSSKEPSMSPSRRKR